MNFYPHLDAVVKEHGSVDLVNQGIQAERATLMSGKAPVHSQKIVAKTGGKAITSNHTGIRGLLEELTGQAYKQVPPTVIQFSQWTRYGLGVNLTYSEEVYGVALTVPVDGVNIIIYQEPCVTSLQVPVQAVHRALKNHEYVLLLKAANALRERRNYSASA